MQPSPTYKKIKDAVQFIQPKTKIQPEIGVILGSGLGSIAARIENPITIPYSEIPHFHGTAVDGHAGKMIVGNFNGVPTVFLAGRFHVYEGHTMEEVAFPTRTLCALGIKTLVLTNAAGAINTRYRPGDIMIIEDHLNLTGDNPLKGPNLSELGPRFPDMTEAYNRECIQAIESAAEELGITLQKGVYAGLLGPTYETPAEIKMLRVLGGDTVGMSTIPETIAANHLGVRVCGFSCVTNLGAGMSPQKLTHQDVVENSKMSAEKMDRLLYKLIPKLIYKKS
jgi:purine-nucleoside phosphorylase